MLRNGISPIVEPGLEDLLVECSDRLSFDTPPASLGDSHVVMVAVGTPSTSYGAADLSYVRDAIAMIAREATPGTTVVMKSTVPPGTGRALSAELTEAGCTYASNPEFLREGSALQDFFETDRVVVGATGETAFKTMRELYAGLDTSFVECDVASAEMIKYASNAFLATKISFINEIANICSRVGADIDSVATGVGMDSRIGSAFLNAGIGYGGSCFPKDTRALDFLAVANDYDFRLLKAVIEVNARQRLLPIKAIESRLGSLTDRTIAILGITFKPSTDDTREAPALDIATMLGTEGARARVYDPEGTLPEGVRATQYDDVYETLSGADAIVIAVEWPEFQQLDWNRIASLVASGTLVFDGRNCIDPAPVEAAGLVYEGVGRQTGCEVGCRTGDSPSA
jgi:UDPglucose 6-dehydrogenase